MSTDKPPDLIVVIKLAKGALITKPAQDALLNRTVAMLGAVLATQSRSISFPEHSIPATIALRALIKKTNIQRLRATAKRLVGNVCTVGEFQISGVYTRWSKIVISFGSTVVPTIVRQTTERGYVGFGLYVVDELVFELDRKFLERINLLLTCPSNWPQINKLLYTFSRI